MTPLKIIQGWVVRYPKRILFLTLFLGASVVPSLLFLKNDPSPHLLPVSHPARQALQQLREDFTGTNSGVFIMLEAKDTIFKTNTLERIQRLTEAIQNMQLLSTEDLEALNVIAEQMSGKEGLRLQKLLPKEVKDLNDMFWMEFEEMRETLENEGRWFPEWNSLLRNIEVRSAPVVEVTSISNTDDIYGSEEGLTIEKIFEVIPGTPGEMKSLRRRVLENDLFRNSFFSEDGRRTGIFVELAMDEDDSEILYSTYIALERIFEENPGIDKHYIAGFPIVAATLRTVIDQDTQRFSPFVALLAVFSLWLTFRRPSGVAVPMLVVGFSILFTLAIMVVFEVPLNTITSALPVFLISIGVADGIHMFSEYRENRIEGLPREKAVCLMLDKLALPVTMTSITTAVGFLSLTVSDIVPIFTFGIFVAVGTLLAMVLSLIFIPALLMVLPEKVSASQEGSGTDENLSRGVHQVNFMDRLFQKSLDVMTAWVLRNARPVLLAALAICAISIYGLSQVKVESSLESYFQTDAPLVVANRAMEKLSGSRTINIVITKTGEEEPWKNPDNLKVVEEFQEFLANEPKVKRTLSLVDLIKRISYAFNENRKEFNRLPNGFEFLESEEIFEENGQTEKRTVKREISGRDLIAQYLVLYENSGGDVLSDVVDSEYLNLNLAVTISSNSTTEEEKLLQSIEDYAVRQFPQGFSMTSSGMVPINVATSNEVVTSQIRSLSGSILAVFLMLALIFRSVSRGLMGMIPLVFTVLFNFGVMGFFGVHLDIGTALVSSIVIGIGVDYSIHYLSSMFHELADGTELHDAISNTVRRSGKAITSNAVTVGFGFLALSVSEFLPLVTLSWMIWLTLNISALATMILIPALAVTLTDVLKLVPSQND
ncbi:MAG TPA: RND family transporter [Candidatus Lambdaproteobacteria bacterium]|nr:RND family transporter [Candidatus Lambdaproteobacteria bacterium]